MCFFFPVVVSEGQQIGSFIFIPVFLNLIVVSADVNNTSLLSWNVKGINNPVKRSRVFAHLKSMSSDIFTGNIPPIN